MNTANASAAQNAGAKTIDFFDTLCPGDVCSTRGASGWNYRDNGHISVAASRALAESFAASLAP